MKLKKAQVMSLFPSLLAVLLTLEHVASEPAWFQICDQKQKFTLNSVDCKTGLWLSKKLQAGCICIHGVWAISTELCDSEFIVFVGSGDCFNLKKPIHSVKLIGDVEDPFAPSTFIVSDTFDSVTKVPQHGYSSTLGNDGSYVVTINPNRTLMRSDYEVCLRVRKKHLDKPVHIWKNSRRVSDKFRFISDEKCPNPLPYDKHVNFGETFTEGEVQDAEASFIDCSSQCLITPNMFKEEKPARPVAKGRGVSYGRSSGVRISSGRAARPRSQVGLGRSASGGGSTTQQQQVTEMLDKEGVSKIKWDGLYSLNTKLKFLNGNGLSETDRQNRRNWYSIRQNMTIFPMAHARETREQSVRMLQAHTGFLMLNQPAAKINTPEYDYFQKMRQVFMSEAPDDIIPHRIILGLMRMWRQLLWESHNKFQHRENPNPEQYGRVMQNLEKCLVNVSKEPMVFILELNISTGANETKMKPYSTHGCYDATEMVYWNDSSQPPVLSATDPVTYLKTDLDISPGLKFDRKIHDLSIDLAYKIFLFTFYRCSVYFELNANDHSEMAEKVQSLFNYPIVKRWSESENFNDLLPLIFPEMNITRFGMAMDRLVAAAKDASPWPEFLSRPTLSITEPDLPKKAGDTYRGKRSVIYKTKKRDLEFWGSRAHCLKAYTDPIEVYGHKPEKDCYVAQPARR